MADKTPEQIIELMENIHDELGMFHNHMEGLKKTRMTSEHKMWAIIVITAALLIGTLVTTTIIGYHWKEVQMAKEGLQYYDYPLQSAGPDGWQRPPKEKP